MSIQTGKFESGQVFFPKQAPVDTTITHLRGDSPKLLAPPDAEAMKPVDGEVLPFEPQAEPQAKPAARAFAPLKDKDGKPYWKSPGDEQRFDRYLRLAYDCTKARAVYESPRYTAIALAAQARPQGDVRQSLRRSRVCTAICARGASATHWRAAHVNWFTRRGWHKRYRRRHARACAPIWSVGSGAHSHDHTGDRTGGRDLGAVPRRMS